MKTCLYCGETIYGDDEGLICYRCKKVEGLGTKRESYDREDKPKDPTSFSDPYFDKINYENM